MAKLNQILAVEKGVRAHCNDSLTSTYHQIQKVEPFAGISRTYEAKDEDGDQLPPEQTKVQLRVEGLLSNASDVWSRLLDVTAARDFGNTIATADVVVDGQTIVTAAPPTYLIWLEKQLVNMRTLVSKLPTLDPAFDWEENAAADAWATPPAKTTRSKKVPRSHVLYEATPEHPAQVQIFTEDEIVGYWTTTKFSGAVPQARIQQLLDRIDALQEAVKTAREEANSKEVPNVTVGENLFGYLLAD